MLGAKVHTVTPQTTSLVAGRYALVPGTPYTVVGTILPAGPREVQRLEEAARVSAKYTLYVEGTAPPIKVADQNAVPKTPGDRIAWKGRNYVVSAELDFTEHDTGLPHKSYILSEIAGDEQ
jgi:hypothetical protein